MYKFGDAVLLRLASGFKQFFAAFLAILTLGLNVMYVSIKGETPDTESNYVSQIENVRMYGNTLETAIPQTKIADMISNHFSSALPSGKTEKKAIIIGYDGARADAASLGYKDFGAIEMLLEDGAKAYIAHCGGVNYPAVNTQATSTAPGWCSILTGEWGDVTGVTSNGVTKSLDKLTLLTTLVESGTIDSSAFYTMWDGHFESDDSTYKLEKAYCEEKGLDVTFDKNNTDVTTVSSLLGDLAKTNCSDFLFAILETPDGMGHATGFSSYNPKYDFGIKLAEIHGRMILNNIKSRPTYETEDWLIIITSDHGGLGNGHGGASIQERMTFIVSNKDFAEFVPTVN